MNRRLILLAVAWAGLTAAAVALAWLLQPAPEVPPAASAVSVPRASAPHRTKLPRPGGAPGAASSTHTSAVAASPAPASPTRLPSAAPALSGSGAGIAGGEVADAPVPLTGQELVDALNTTRDEGLLPGAAHCIPGASLPSGFTGQLELELSLDDHGLTEATVADLGASDVAFPQSMLDCLSDAVWGQDWPAAAEETTVHYPLVVTTN